MDLSEPMLSVIPSVTGSVLAVLARAGEPLTGRGLAERVKPAASHAGVQRALAGLVEAGVVDRVDRGRAALYTLNRDHLAASAIAELAGMRDTLLGRLQTAIAGWPQGPTSAVLFGSAARGDGGRASDVDLLLVRSEGVPADESGWGAQIADLTVEVQRWTGNPLRTVELSQHQVADQLGSGEPYLEAALNDGILLAGVPLRRLRKASAG